MTLQQRGPKWEAAGYNNVEEPVEISCKIREVIQILDSKNTTFVVKTKCTSILVDNCTKVQVVLEANVVGNIELNKFNRSTLRAAADANLFQVSKSSGSHIWMTPANAEKVSIHVSGSDAMNLHYIDEETENEVEIPLPEQILTHLGADLDPKHYAIVPGQDPPEMEEKKSPTESSPTESSPTKSTTTTTTSTASPLTTTEPVKKKSFTPTPKSPKPGKHMALESRTKADVASKFRAFTKTGQPGSWVVVDHHMSFVSEGVGINSLRDCFDEKKIQFAAMRVDGVDQQESIKSVRPKMVQVNWVGSGVKAKHKGKALVGKQKASTIFTGMSVFVDCTSKTDLEVKDICHELLRCGGAHKPTHYHLGPDDSEIQALASL